MATLVDEGVDDPPAHSASHDTAMSNQSPRLCYACRKECVKSDGVLVRALGRTYHLNCFVCEDCHTLVAAKFYVTQDNCGIVCERHYMERLGLLCQACHEPVLGPVDPGFMYHPQCMQCPECDGSAKQDIFFEYCGKAYCRHHFAMLPGTQCAGCDQAIFQQFVEHRDHPDKKWHPECYMIQKFWNVRLADAIPKDGLGKHDRSPDLSRALEHRMEERASRIWTELSAFEESSATCISDMLLHVAAGAYLESLRMAHLFVLHLRLLFIALDNIRIRLSEHDQEFECGKEAKAICSQVIRFFHMLQNNRGYESTRHTFGVTQELLPLVTNMAQHLKALIHLGLTECMRLERDFPDKNVILEFLDTLLPLEKTRIWIDGRYWFKDHDDQICQNTAIVDPEESCQRCGDLVADQGFQNDTLQWHLACFACIECHSPLQNQPQRARLCQPNNALRCINCCTDKECEHSASHDTFVHIPLLQQSLGHVHRALASLDSRTGRIPNESKAAYEIGINRHATRQSTPLPSMDGSRRQATNFGSVHIQNVKNTHQKPMTLSQRLKKPHSTNSVKRAKLMFQDNPAASHPPSPAMTSGRHSIRIDTLRRALTNTHRKRRSLNGVFDRRRRSELYQHQTPQCASICSFETSNGGTLIPTISPIMPTALHLAELNSAQDMLVRCMAVLSMQPFVRTQFSMDQLVAMTESKRASLWGRLKAHIKTGTHGKPGHDVSASNRTFGVPLSVLVTRDKQREATSFGTVLHDSNMASCFSPQAMIPVFVQGCILTLLGMDMAQEGIFRKNGNIRELNEICESIDSDTSGQVVFEGLQDAPIQLAALLKRYLRELPEPLLTFKLYDLLISATRVESETQAKTMLHLACCMLPKPNRDTMQLIFLFLKWVASFKNSNKMDVSNLARVFAPTVISASSEAAVKQLTEDRQRGAQDEIKVVEMLIQYQEEFCMVPQEFVPVLQNPMMEEHLESGVISKPMLRQLNLRIKSNQALSSSPCLPTLPAETEKRPLGSLRSHRRSWIPGRH